MTDLKPIRRDPPASTPNGPDRVESIDLVRGAVMVVMVLDHVRDFFGNANLDPTDLSTTTPALFFTRWVTHYCAPTFLFLAGVSAFLSGARRSKPELSRHLLVRGFWLIVLEQTLVSVCLFFTYPQFLFCAILWAIGWSMIVLAVLIYLPRPIIGAIGLGLIAFHNTLDPIVPGEGGWGLLWSLLHVRGFRVLPGGLPILVGYPLIPWVGVVALGYALGPLFRAAPSRRRLTLTAMGLAALAGFVVLRWSRTYGDPRPWEPREDFLFSLMSFLNCEKYPPSLLYLLMTLGPAWLALAAFDRGIGRAGRPLEVLGRVPLFFYLLQWPVAHGLAVIVAAIQGYPTGWMFRLPPFQSPLGYGESLGMVYLFWIITVALLYGASRWYGEWARRRS